MQDICSQLNFIDFNSDLWEKFRGAYGNIKDDLSELFNIDADIPENEKAFYIHKAPESNYRIAFDNICAQLMHQGSFYSALYIAMPYLVKIYEYWLEKNDFDWQVLYLTNIGLFIATDNSYNHQYDGMSLDDIDENIRISYIKSIDIIKKRAEEFILKNIEKLKKFDRLALCDICIGLLAIVGDREDAFVLDFCHWDICDLFCNNCKYIEHEENIELDSDIGTDYLSSIIIPADSVIGQWDKKTFDNTYVWLSNLLYILGDKKAAEKLSYYFGTYICPECGYKSSPVIKLIMRSMCDI